MGISFNNNKRSYFILLLSSHSALSALFLLGVEENNIYNCKNEEAKMNDFKIRLLITSFNKISPLIFTCT